MTEYLKGGALTSVQFTCPILQQEISLPFDYQKVAFGGHSGCIIVVEIKECPCGEEHNIEVGCW